MNDLTFTVLGRPQQKGSHRSLPIRRKSASGALVRTGQVITDTNVLLEAWSSRVATAAMTAHGVRGLIHSPVRVEIDFYFARPKSHYGSGRNCEQVRPGAPQFHVTKPDIDKLVRGILDAMTGIVLVDDSRVVAVDAVKHYGDPERAEVRVTDLGALAVTNGDQ